LGTHDPFTKKTVVDKTIVTKWLGEGAIASQTVKMLLKKVQLNEKAGEVKAS